MNLGLDDAEEVHMKTKNRKPLGKNVRRLVPCYVLNRGVTIHSAHVSIHDSYEVRDLIF